MSWLEEAAGWAGRLLEATVLFQGEVTRPGPWIDSRIIVLRSLKLL
jgi:hypothetical protein